MQLSKFQRNQQFSNTPSPESINDGTGNTEENHIQQNKQKYSATTVSPPPPRPPVLAKRGGNCTF